MTQDTTFHIKNCKKFNSWIDYTLKESKEKNKISIIINKSDYTLYLIEKGKIYSKYPIELGGNPFDDKQKKEIPALLKDYIKFQKN